MKKDPFAKREAAKYDNPIPSRELILQTMKDIDAPVAMQRLIELLAVTESESQVALSHRLRAMIRDGQIVSPRKLVYAIADRMEVVSGRIIAHPDGFGFLNVPDRETDVYLPFRQMRMVFHGDVAQVRIRGRNQRGREEGEIIEVVERNTPEVIGRLVSKNNLVLLEAMNNRITQEVIVRDASADSPGQIVVVHIDEQPTFHTPAFGHVVEILGDRLTPKIEVDIVLRNHDIPHEFPDDVLDEASNMPMQVRPADKRGRTALQKLPFVTIDGEDAKDFDDAVLCEPRKGGGFQLKVAIADVGHYVRKDSPLDSEAFRRGTSVYFPDFVVPMLPEAISNGLCSLRPDVDRLVLVCDMTITAKGNVSSYQFYEGVIHSHARLTYNQVASYLEAGDKTEITQQSVQDNLDSLYDLFKVLMRMRKERGALEIDSPEVMFTIDEGRITGVATRERNDAHRLIEECMLCANVCAARFTRHYKKPGLYRVHAAPDDDKAEALGEQLAGFGVKATFQSPVQPEDFENVLRQLRGRPNSRILQLSVLRSLNQAVYQPANEGHFGLNYKEYAHFTSPIRRLPDLLTHRLSPARIPSDEPGKHARAPPKPVKRNAYSYDLEAMLMLGEQASMTERRAESAGYDLLEWMKCQYIADHEGDIMGGIVSAVTKFGLFVEVDEVFVEGLIHISNLPGEYYHFEQATQTLVGDRSGAVFGLGDSVTVQVARVDPDERKVDLELISHNPTRRRHAKGKGESKTRSVAGKAGAKKGREKRSSAKKGRGKSSADAKSEVKTSLPADGGDNKPGKKKPAERKRSRRRR